MIRGGEAAAFALPAQNATEVSRTDVQQPGGCANAYGNLIFLAFRHVACNNHLRHKYANAMIESNKNLRSQIFLRRLQEALTAKGWTQRELAKRTLLSETTISRWFTDGAMPQPSTIEAIAGVLGVRRESLTDEQIDTQTQSQNTVEDSVNVATSFGSDPRRLIQKRREEMGITREELAQRTRFKADYIREIEEAGVRPNEKFLAKAAKILDLPLEALMAGSDHPPVHGEQTQTFGSQPRVNLTDGITAKVIPLISMAQAGELVSYEDVYDYEGVVSYDGKDPKAFAVRIRGDSMSPDYKEGSIAILFPSRCAQNDNLIVTKLKDGSVLFKRLRIANGKFILISINPIYPPIEVDEEQVAWMYPVGKTQKDEL